MSLADELLADLDEVGGEEEDNRVRTRLAIYLLVKKYFFTQHDADIMEAMEGVEEGVDPANQSVRAIAKLADSDQVRVLSPNVSFVWFHVDWGV